MPSSHITALGVATTLLVATGRNGAKRIHGVRLRYALRYLKLDEVSFVVGAEGEDT